MRASNAGYYRNDPNSFKYRLNGLSGSEIRVLKLSALEPGAEHLELRCSLEHTTLGTAPVYSALSYVWGDPNDTEPILVDGKPCGITVNLEAGLRHLAVQLGKQAQPYTYLWVDALCINQACDPEKTQQVALMSHIFRTADLVTIWLGRSSENSAQAFDALARLRSMREVWPFDELYSWPLFQFSGTSPWERAVTTQLDDIFHQLFHEDESALSAIFSLFDRAWFRRVWVIQEVALSRTAVLLCGGHVLDWDDFWFAYWMLMGLRDYLNIVMPQGQTSMVAASILNSKLGNVAPVVFPWIMVKHSLLQLLSYLASDTDAAPLEASDRRDFVFALLGLANDRAELDLRADYTKEWDEVKVYVAMKLLRYNGLITLSFCGLDTSDPGPDYVPSWAPNWASRHLPRPLSVPSRFRVRGGAKDSAYNASGRMSQMVTESSFGPGGRLTLVAIYVDRISRLGNSLPDGTIQDSVLATWLVDLRDMLRGPNRIYNTAEKVEDAWWRTPIADRGQVYNYETLRATEELRCGYRMLVDDDQGRQNTTEAARYAAIARHKLRQRRSFKTSQGYLAIGPDALQEEDFVWVVLGVSVPLVLRNCGNGCWTIVGEAYVHGIMDGEITEPREQVFSTINII